MSKIKLTGENSGYVELSAGQNAGNNTLELPISGTKVVASDDSGNVNNLGIVTATTFSGNLTGNVTGNVTGNLTGNVNASGNSTFDGSVGIGTNTPTQKLEVYGGKIFIDGGGNRKITLDPGSNTTYEPRIDASHDLVFRSYVDSGPGVKTCTFNSNGDLDLTQGRNLKFASGNGIDFSATAGPTNGAGTSEILSDYEEGTWTPAAFLSYNPSGTKSVSTGGSPTGQYVKVGKVVTAWFYLPYTLSGTGSYNMGMNGLPFTADNALTPMCGGARESSATGTFYQCESVTGTTIQVFRRYDNGAAYDGTGQMYGFIIYRAA